MPVTAYPAPHEASLYTQKSKVYNASDYLLEVCPEKHSGMRNNHMIQSSFDICSDLNPLLLDTYPIEPSRNGFVNSAITAYSHHHHLILRPDDVWLAVLTQLSLYINKNAEKLRDKFVAHQGQSQLIVNSNKTFKDADFGDLAYCMGLEIEKRVVDPELRSWIMPDFSTTLVHDRVVASVVFMGSMQKYFAYSMALWCGLPSVTLLGEKHDWEKLCGRLEKLRSFGPETATWYSLLVPVFHRFVGTFNAPHSDRVKQFWQKIAHRRGGGSGPTFYSGWITAFCFFDATGMSIYGRNTRWEPLELDGVRYLLVDSELVPPGYASVPVKVFEKDTVWETMMVAGSVGWRVTSSLGRHKAWRDLPNQLQPVSGWWMFERKTEESMEEDKRVKREKEEERRKKMAPKWEQLGEKRLGRG